MNRIIHEGLIGQYNKRIPNYYKEMFIDGYQPWEIYVAFKRQMSRKVEELRENGDAESNQQDEPIAVQGEVYVNGKRI